MDYERVKDKMFYCEHKDTVEVVHYMGHWYYCPGPHYKVRLVITDERTTHTDD